MAFIKILLSVMPHSKQEVQELKKLGAHIKKLRLEKGMTQKELAGEMGIDFQHIYRLEKGEQNVSYLTIRNVAKGLSINPSELLRGLDES